MFVIEYRYRNTLNGVYELHGDKVYRERCMAVAVAEMLNIDIKESERRAGLHYSVKEMKVV